MKPLCRASESKKRSCETGRSLTVDNQLCSVSMTSGDQKTFTLLYPSRAHTGNVLRVYRVQNHMVYLLGPLLARHRQYEWDERYSFDHSVQIRNGSYQFQVLQPTIYCETLEHNTIFIATCDHMDIGINQMS